MYKRCQAILDYLQEHIFPCYVVGGFNRERLLGRLSYDLDLIVEEGAWQLARQLAKQFRCAFVPLDEIRDIARLVIDKEISIDIARYAGKSLDEDLKNRDFTINSIACQLHLGLFDLNYPVEQLPFYDPWGGIQDL